MRFSIVFLLPFLSILTGALALPTPRGHSLGVRDSSAVSFDSRELELDIEDLERRGKPYQLKAPKAKVTKAHQTARKTAVRQGVAQRQQQNAVHKTQRAAAYAAHVASGGKAYGKPRKPGPPNKPGFRAAGRAPGPAGEPSRRIAKQPKTPKPNMAKGAAKTDKHKRTQAAANAKSKARKAEGKKHFAYAAEQQKKTINMPGRKKTFTTPGGTQTVTGKDVRTAIFNSHHFSQGTNEFAPKPFRNDEQGPAGNRQRPLAKLHGQGTEYPANSQRGGYQGNPAHLGAVRVITQTKPDGTHKFKGVISHDERRLPTHPGYNDHFQLQERPKPLFRNRVAAIMPFMKPKGSVGSATGP